MSVAGNPWICIAVAYGGYWLGIKAAQQATGRQWLGESADLAGTITSSNDDDDDAGHA